MGVKGLLPVLQSITHPTPLERYEGLSVAVDAMSWLHKGLYGGDVRSLAKSQFDDSKKKYDTKSYSNGNGGVVRKINFESCKEKEKNAKKNNDIYEKAEKSISSCVFYVTKRAQMLQNDYKMDVVLVIDGSALPIKEEENTKRRSERQSSYLEAQKAESNGDTRAARKLYARACAVTQEMKYELILACQRIKIPFLVAPYEADAQMARLAHSGTVDLIISEDSDLLAYGCPRVLYKIDFGTKRGEEIQIMRDLAMNEPLSFRNWTHDMFVYMCIFSGCDYFPGVHGLGVKGAYKLVRLNRSPSKIFAALRKSGKMDPDEECKLKECFWKAFRTFRHQRVYCAEKAILESLFPVDELLNPNYDENTWPYLGPWMEPKFADGIAIGKLHPDKKVPWECTHKKNKIQSQPSQSRPPHSGTTCPNDSNASKNQPKIEAELFAFFPSKKNHKKHEDDFPSTSLNSCRPPLQEIYIDNSHENIETSLEDDQSDFPCPKPLKQKNKYKCQPIPIHFNDYNSKLVGSSFKTLSRRNQNSNNRNFNITQIARRLLRGKEAKKQKKDNNENHLVLTANTANNIITNDQADASERLSSCPNSTTYNNDTHMLRPRCHSSPNVNVKSNSVAKSQEKKTIEYHNEGNIYGLDINEDSFQIDTLERLSSCPNSKTYVESSNVFKPRCRSNPDINRTNSGITLPEKVIIDEFAKENICDMNAATILSVKPYDHCSQNVLSALDSQSKDKHYNRYEVDDAWNGIMKSHNEELINFPVDVKLENNEELDFFINQRDINDNLTRSPCSKRQNYDDSDFDYCNKVVHIEKSNDMNLDFKYSDEVVYNEKNNEMMKYVNSYVPKFNFQLKEDIDKYQRCTNIDVAEDDRGIFDEFSSVDLICRNKYETSNFNCQLQENVDDYQQSNYLYTARENDFDRFSSESFNNFDTDFNRNNRSTNSQKKKSIEYDISKEASWKYTVGIDDEQDEPRCHIDFPACSNEHKYQSSYKYTFDSVKKVGRNRNNLNTWEQISYNYGSNSTDINTPKVKYKQDASILSAVKKFSNI